MTIEYNTLEVEIDLSAIRHNYRILCEKGTKVYGVIKADAYGHGLIEVADALSKEGADTFAVGTVNEAVELRKSGRGERIIALLGLLNETDCFNAVKYNVIPFIGEFEQLEMLSSVVSAQGQKIEISLKFDTGMSRLGFSVDELDQLIDWLKANPQISPVLTSSHLATSDDPAYEDYVGAQADQFSHILKELESAGFELEASLANSAGILVHDKVRLMAQRAGIALYGANPLSGTKWNEIGGRLIPAMQVSTKIASVHTLKKGRSISYGCTYTAEKDMTVAIVCAGYADGYSRSLSNTGQVCINGKRAKIVGRVCMQLTAVDVTDIPDVSFGGRAYLLGGEGEGKISPDDLAGWWETITYEVFCLLGQNPKTFK
ncbi:alanine racemase [Maridesulfovibrio hydrothermalis]|uniref:Alanine racemase n=1 Tax=Maridesulfovibrio hydrothermalis AM13 = DSM 14728 TaxID=1121451 RepID=L0RA35_9BACT|nr:alanine racemase [Maridesulfovibrio hydrothermalis]CCO23619.1 Alanine racemase [Maridesulfovibrio hydrothermalis AM13 = DSM 14728]